MADSDPDISSIVDAFVQFDANEITDEGYNETLARNLNVSTEARTQARQETRKRMITDRKRIDRQQSDAELYDMNMAKRQRMAAAMSSTDSLMDKVSEHLKCSTEDLDEAHHPVGTLGDRDAYWGDEKESEEWVACRDDFSRELESLAEPGEELIPRSCFGCTMSGADSPYAVYVEKWMQFFEAFKRGLMEIGSITLLAHQLHTIFHENVAVVVDVPDKLSNPFASSEDNEPYYIAKGAPSSQIWSRYQIMYHFLFHSCDPEIRAWVLLKRVRSATDTLFSNNLIKIHRTSSRKDVDKDSLLKIKEAIALESSVSKWATDTMLFANKKAKLPNDYLRLNPGRQTIRGNNLNSQFRGINRTWS